MTRIHSAALTVLFFLTIHCPLPAHHLLISESENLQPSTFLFDDEGRSLAHLPSCGFPSHLLVKNYWIRHSKLTQLTQSTDQIPKAPPGPPPPLAFLSSHRLGTSASLLFPPPRLEREIQAYKACWASISSSVWQDGGLNGCE